MKYMIYVMTTVVTVGIPTVIGVVYNDHVDQVVMAEDVSANKQMSKENAKVVQTLVTCMEVVKKEVEQINANIKDIKSEIKAQKTRRR